MIVNQEAIFFNFSFFSHSISLTSQHVACLSRHHLKQKEKKTYDRQAAEGKNKKLMQGDIVEEEEEEKLRDI